jgi:hypothetical protein
LHRIALPVVSEWYQLARNHGAFLALSERGFAGSWIGASENTYSTHLGE